MASVEFSNPEVLGAISGIVACLIFIIFHQITISNIWFSSPFMLVISAIAGYTLVKSYLQLFDKYSNSTWFGYNSYFILSLTLLSLLSVLVFSPRYDSEEVLNADGGPPEGLISSALPLTITWMFITALVITYWVSRTFEDFPIVLGTSAVLLFTLGLNLSILGFVEVLDQHQYLVQKFLLMNVGLGATFFLLFSAFRGLTN